MKYLAIIPARSGSKSLKHKNIKELCGKPLMAYSIEAAINSEVFDKVFVSTDSEEYREIAQKYGADASFLRSEQMSSDTASSWDAVKEVIENFEKRGENFDRIMLLQPTSPLREADDIREAVKLMDNKNANSIISVSETEQSPLLCTELPPDQDLSEYMKKRYSSQPRQLMPTYYQINGAIYLLNKGELYKNPMFCEKCYAYIMTPDNSVDIDTEMDFLIAETLMRRYNE